MYSTGLPLSVRRMTTRMGCATVVSAGDISTIVKGARPKPGTSRVDLLKGGDYWRVWINKGGTHYIINLPPA